MKTRTRTLLGGAALLGVILAGGTAFTAGNSMPDPTVVGYGTQNISGVQAVSVNHHFNPTGEQIESIDLVLNGDTTMQDIEIGFTGQGALVPCNDVGAFDSEVDLTTSYSCTGLTFDSATANEFRLTADMP